MPWAAGPEGVALHARHARARSGAGKRGVGNVVGTEAHEKAPLIVGDREEIRVLDLVAIFASYRLHGGRVVGRDRGLQDGEVGDQPRVALEVLEQRFVILLDEMRRLVETALQFALGLPGHRAIDEIHGAADRQHRNQRGRKEDPVRERREGVHRIVKSASTSASPTVIGRCGGSPCTVSFQTASV